MWSILQNHKDRFFHWWRWWLKLPILICRRKCPFTINSFRPETATLYSKNGCCGVLSSSFVSVNKAVGSMETRFAQITTNTCRLRYCGIRVARRVGVHAPAPTVPYSTWVFPLVEVSSSQSVKARACYCLTPHRIESWTPSRRRIRIVWTACDFSTRGRLQSVPMTSRFPCGMLVNWTARFFDCEATRTGWRASSFTRRRGNSCRRLLTTRFAFGTWTATVTPNGGIALSYDAPNSHGWS